MGSLIILVIFGIAVGMIARRIVPSHVPGGFVMNGAIGLAGALIGAWIASAAFHIHITRHVFSPSTWISAILGAVLLLVIVRSVFRSMTGGRRFHMPRFHR
jgi:uncharacterized membrane protein YeaQ/YmgE (transglycosylase-associated protein family)